MSSASRQGPNEPLSDGYQADLVARIVDGDAGAEAELVAIFERPLRAMIWFRVRDAEAARDLVQDVFVAALQGLRRKQLLEPSRLAAFLHGIAKNLANDFIRKASRRPLHVEVEPDASWADARSQFEATARLREVARALDELDPEDRRLLTLTLVEGCKPGEVAAQMGVSSEVVRTRKTRAFARLVGRLGSAVTKSSR